MCQCLGKHRLHLASSRIGCTGYIIITITKCLQNDRTILSMCIGVCLYATCNRSCLMNGGIRGMMSNWVKISAYYFCGIKKRTVSMPYRC